MLCILIDPKFSGVRFQGGWSQEWDKFVGLRDKEMNTGDPFHPSEMGSKITMKKERKKIPKYENEVEN